MAAGAAGTAHGINLLRGRSMRRDSRPCCSIWSRRKKKRSIFIPANTGSTSACLRGGRVSRRKWGGNQRPTASLGSGNFGSGPGGGRGSGWAGGVATEGGGG